MNGDLILGIETSCDDTAVALVDRHGVVAAASVASQAALHSNYGGVYPELAGRAHVEKIIPTVQQVLDTAAIGPGELRAIGVTRGPGLIGSLLVGLNTACGLGHGWQVPVFGVNHLRGHLRSADLEERRVTFPAMVLLVSGGHTLLAMMTDPINIKPIGSTIDDSVGEAYDKVARMLGLGYPGGPVVDKLAMTGKPVIAFPRPLYRRGLDFSFSGLKSAVNRYIVANRSNPDIPPADVAASFVDACIDVLVSKCRSALRQFSSSSLVVVGGVAASPQLRAAAKELCDEFKMELCLPPLKWSTDNGAMIGLAAWDNVTLNLSHALKPVTSLAITDI